MIPPWQLRVYDRQALVHSEDVAEPVELGRQDEGELACASGLTCTLAPSSSERRRNVSSRSRGA